MSFINIEKVIEKVKNQNTSLNERREAIRLLGQSGSEQAVDALVDLLPDLNLRLDIVHALGTLANGKATKFLLATMFESDTKVKIEIIKALRRIGDTKCVGTLVQLFQVEDDEQVKSAVFILITEFGTFDDVFQIVPSCIQYPSPHVQMLALKYIADKGDQRTSSMLYPLLFSPDDKVRISAANILWRLEGQLLLKRLNYILVKTEDVPKQNNVIQIFGALGLVQTVEPLIYTLLKNEDKQVKINCLDSLQKIGDKRALGAIIQVIKIDDEDIRAKAIECLSSFPEPKVTASLINALRTTSEKIRNAAMSSLEKLVSSSDVASLKKYFQTEDDNIKVFLCKTLGKTKFFDNEIHAFLKSSLTSSHEKVINEALIAVGALEAKELMDLVISHFRHSNEDIRVCAIKVAGQLNDLRCIDPIVECYKTDQSNKVRATIIEILGKTKDKKYIKTAEAALKDSDARVRANAIETLEALGGEEIVDLIYPIFQNDSNNRVKANAAKTLWKFGGIRMISALEGMLLKEKDKWQRASAAFALGEIGSIQVVKSLTQALQDSEDCVRGNAVKGLGKTQAQDVIPVIIPLLEDPSDRVREDSVVALGKIGTPEILDPILKFLKQQNDSKLIDVVYKALIDAVDQRFLLPLTRALNDDLWIVKVAAAKLLGKIGNDSTIPLLTELLSDGNVIIRNSAEDSIEQIKRRL
ncbi:MAG TPA: HEAT repeat domain-containing protein [Candidatus Wallbacteria bacterium]|nr:HEAT repeat domain-containing protein [Candidatus Wallbacteria bacterium]